MTNLLKMTTSLQSTARVGLLGMAILLSVARIPDAHADQILLASTNFIYGSSAATFSFDAPSAGTVTTQIASVPWPVPLSALSFSATNATDTLASWSGAGTATPQVESFQVGSGTYFAHVMATAAGSLNVGLYSLMVTFSPSAVPLPDAAGLLLVGVLVLFGLLRSLRGVPPLGPVEAPTPH